MELLQQLTWIDWALLAVLAISIVIGLVRGFVFECLSLAGWVVAWFAAQWSAPWVSLHLPVGAPGSALNLGAAFALAFIAALVLWGLLAKLIRMLIHATPLSIPDRLLGAGFGVLRGGVVLLLVVLAVSFTPLGKSPAWHRSVGVVWLNSVWQELKPALWGEGTASRAT